MAKLNKSCERHVISGGEYLNDGWKGRGVVEKRTGRWKDDLKQVRRDFILASVPLNSG